MKHERRVTDSGDLLMQIVSVIAVALSGMAAWILVLRVFDLPPILLPSPLRVFQAAMQKRNELALGMLSTGIAATVGLAAAILIGCLASILFSQSRTIRRAFFPYVIFLQTVPIVAIAPLLITWSGYKFRTVVIVTVIICLFPIINNVTAGLMTIERELADLFRLYGANRAKRLWKLQIPSAVPYLVLGAKISSGLAVIGAIVAEFFVGNGTSFSGLGSLMTDWQGMQKTDALIAALFLSTLLGLLLFGSVHLVSHYLLRRWTRTETSSWQKS